MLIMVCKDGEFDLNPGETAAEVVLKSQECHGLSSD